MKMDIIPRRAGRIEMFAGYRDERNICEGQSRDRDDREERERYPKFCASGFAHGCVAAQGPTSLARVHANLQVKASQRVITQTNPASHHATSRTQGQFSPIPRATRHTRKSSPCRKNKASTRQPR